MNSDAGDTLAVWHDMAPERETEISNGYRHQHHLERLPVPGFLSARRHVALRGTPIFYFYETESAGVPISRPYLDRLNDPTDWTRRSTPHLRNNPRSVCRSL